MSLDPAVPTDGSRIHPASSWLAVAVPTEHGGWAFTLEPVLLGLLVAYSWPGILLGLIALLGFLLRTPLKTVMVDRRRHRSLPRTVMARNVAIIEGMMLVGLVGVVLIGSNHRFVVPLLMAVPLVAIEFWHDIRSRSRRLVPELAGTVGIGSVAAAVALIGGASPSVAAGLWLVIAARSVAAVIFVRAQLRRAKQQPYKRTGADAGQALAVLAVTAGAVAGLVPWIGWGSIVVLAIVHSWLVRRAPSPIPMIGAQQVVLGLFVVLTAGLAFIVP